jgi:hypothetical protein
MKKWIACKAFLLMSLGLWAQPELTATVDKTTVGEFETFQVTFSFNQNAEGLTFPDLKGQFSIVSGPMTSLQSRSINFQQTIIKSWTYQLKPKKRGQMVLGPATIKFDGKTYRSQPISIRVIDQRQRAADPNDPASKAGQYAIVKATLSKRSVYVGEPLIGELNLFWKTQIKQPVIEEEPKFPGMYSQNFELPNQKGRRTTFGGQPAIAATLRKYVLVPKKSGAIDLPESVVTIPVGVPTGRRDWFDNPEYRFVNHVDQVAWPKITVKPLPEKGKPEGFDGAVGNYKLDVSLSREEVKANESVSLKISISGAGNLKLVELPTAQFPPGIESYDPKYTSDVNLTAAGFSGFKREEYLLVPRYKGTYKIAPIEFSYFDVNSKTYKTLTSGPLEITVVDGPAPPLNVTDPGDGKSSVAKDNVAQLGEDIAFIATEFDGPAPTETKIFGTTWFWTLLGVFYFAFASILVWPMIANARKVDKVQEEVRGAGRMAKKRLRATHKALQNNDSAAFFAELEKAIVEFISAKYQVPMAEMNRQKIENVLTTHGQDAKTALDLLGQCEMARYAPSAQADREGIYNKAENWFKSVDS